MCLCVFACGSSLMSSELIFHKLNTPLCFLQVWPWSEFLGQLQSLLTAIWVQGCLNSLKSDLLTRHWNLKSTTVRTEIQWTTLFCVYFALCRLIAQWASEFDASINRLIGDIFFVTKCIVKWAVIWWNLSSFEHLHFLIYPKCTFVRITAFSLLSMNNYTVL